MKKSTRNYKPAVNPPLFKAKASTQPVWELHNLQNGDVKFVKVSDHACEFLEKHLDEKNPSCHEHVFRTVSVHEIGGERGGSLGAVKDAVQSAQGGLQIVTAAALISLLIDNENMTDFHVPCWVIVQSLNSEEESGVFSLVRSQGVLHLQARNLSPGKSFLSSQEKILVIKTNDSEQ